MARLFDRLDSKKGKDLKVLRDFISIFCREKHSGQVKDVFPMKNDTLRQALGDQELILCPDCARLFNHGTAKLLLCPYDPKPLRDEYNIQDKSKLSGIIEKLFLTNSGKTLAREIYL